MDAMVLKQVGDPLRRESRPDPVPGPGEVVVAVSACGVCRTDLHVVDGDLDVVPPVVPGHEVVGRVVATADDITDLRVGQRVGVPWLGWTCGTCPLCLAGRENLCRSARFTGFTRDGGFADALVADARYCLAIPDVWDDAHAAPLLCAGLIGYRALRIAGDGGRLGLYGFGAAAHILCQIAIHQGREVFAFTRPGDDSGQAFAQRLGATWVGGSDERAPVELDTAIIFAPIGALVPAALQAVGPGCRVVSAGIHMSDIPSFPYRLLWEERSVHSVANLTRADGEELFAAAAAAAVQTTVRTWPLSEADAALAALRSGGTVGAEVLLPALGR